MGIRGVLEAARRGRIRADFSLRKRKSRNGGVRLSKGGWRRAKRRWSRGSASTTPLWVADARGGRDGVGLAGPVRDTSVAPWVTVAEDEWKIPGGAATAMRLGS